MHSKECLLDEILDFGCGGADAAAEVPTEVATEHAEELTVRARIALEAAEHQRPEALFGLVLVRHWRVDSLAARERPDSNAGAWRSTNGEKPIAV